ncbi:hypothetical protein SCAPIOD10383 [Staphylococcus capitis]|nr:hypothetical protein CR01_50027 [Staphylococcus capitis CR01]CQD26072.1 hypothetical protein SCAPIOD10383 [Staphylococcus capitis]CQD27449.1 hypothetical protein SCAPIOD170060 [Staphylococcus capitis]CQD31277.1 hypothetical protein SCAPIOD180035 [Staphylococcus capitis]CRN11700.1 hypothetical protein BN151730126 [Staphylococcus capitis]
MPEWYREINFDKLYFCATLFLFSGEIFIQIYKIRVGKTDMMNRETLIKVNDDDILPLIKVHQR